MRKAFLSLPLLMALALPIGCSHARKAPPEPTHAALTVQADAIEQAQAKTPAKEVAVLRKEADAAEAAKESLDLRVLGFVGLAIAAVAVGLGLYIVAAAPVAHVVAVVAGCIAATAFTAAVLLPWLKVLVLGASAALVIYALMRSGVLAHAEAVVEADAKYVEQKLKEKFSSLTLFSPSPAAAPVAAPVAPVNTAIKS